MVSRARAAACDGMGNYARKTTAERARMRRVFSHRSSGNMGLFCFEVDFLRHLDSSRPYGGSLTRWAGRRRSRLLGRTIPSPSSILLLGSGLIIRAGYIIVHDITIPRLREGRDHFVDS